MKAKQEDLVNVAGLGRETNKEIDLVANVFTMINNIHGHIILGNKRCVCLVNSRTNLYGLRIRRF